MSNAAKLKKKAAEFEQKKQFDKALQLYIQILDESDGGDGEGDVALYNRVGDLLMRQGSVGDAMTYYEKAVDLYAESGFFNNAIALCNKILRQSPGRNSVYYKLGKISAKKGFISDAKQNFLEYASRMQSSGHLDEAFRALKEFADLCPEEDDIRLMLAEQLSKKDRKAEALEQLQLLYEKFEHEGRDEDMRATVDRMRAIDPSVEPKAGTGQRSQKSGDLVFLDLGESGPRHPTSPRRVADAPKPASAAKPAAAPAAKASAPPPAPPRTPKPPTADDLPFIEAEADAKEEAEEEQPAVDVESETELEDDLPPLPPAADGDGAAALEGLESSASFTADGGKGGGPVAGYESSALEDELSDALDAALPEGAHPLSGAEFGALRLATPLKTPKVAPPAHDLALPGQLPPVGHGAKPVLSLTGEMQLIIPENDIPVLRSSLLDREGTGSGRSTPAPPPDDASLPSGSTATEDGPDLPLLEVGLDETESSDARGNTGASADDRLSFVGGADLLDVPDLDDEEQATEKEPEVELPDWMDQPRIPAAKHANGRAPLDQPDPASAQRRTSPLHGTRQQTGHVDALRARVEAEPTNWVVRRELAEALFDAGDRDGGMQVLESTMIGLERAQDLEGARSVADEIIRLNPNSVRHHQKRVEYAFRTNDRARLPEAYLELADALFRSGQADKARAVYHRVLELAPDDPRAQAALSTFGDVVWTAGIGEPEAIDDVEESAPADAPIPGPAKASVSSVKPVPPAPKPVAPPKPKQPSNRAAEQSKDRDSQAAEQPASRTTEQPKRAAEQSKRAAEQSSSRTVERKVETRPAEKSSNRLTDEEKGRATEHPGDRDAGRPAAARGKKAAAAQPREDEKASSADAKPASKSDLYVNLGDWLREEEAPRSTRMVVEEEEPTGDEEADFADMLRKFKQGVAQNVSEEDHDSHYDLGVAYKEMGLVDEAIAEFQKALRGPGHRVRAYEALGQCFLEKQQYQVASTILSRALDEPGVTDDQLVGVLYLLGYAAEALVRRDEAVGYYQRVFAVDIQFRDVADRLTALEQESE